MTVLLTGSEGLIGKKLYQFLIKKNYEVLKLDLALGHNLSDEKFVKSYFKENKADAMINLFAMMHHVDGRQDKSTLFDISLDSFNDYLNINLTSLFSVCREFARNNDQGSIVNFSSHYGVVAPSPEIYDNEEKHIGYSVSKAGVIMLSKHMAAHLAPNIRVNTIIPGGFDNAQDPRFKKKYSKKTLLGRMMRVEEIYGMVEYLISDASSYTTGAEFIIDGGWTTI